MGTMVSLMLALSLPTETMGAFLVWLIAFLGGMLASNYDVKTVFIDAFLKLIKIDLADAKWFFDSLEKYAQKHDVTFVLSVSADPEALPDFCKGYII